MGRLRYLPVAITSADQITDGVITQAKLDSTMGLVRDGASGVLGLDSSKRPNLWWALTKNQYQDNTGTSVFASNDTAGSSLSTSYVKVRETTLNRTPDSSLKTYFEIYDGNAPNGLAYGRIYRNGVAVGTERSTNSASYVAFTETISGWADGDLLQLYVHADASSVVVYYQRLRILAALRAEFIVNTL